MKKVVLHIKRARLPKRFNRAGFSTLELLVALAVITLALTVVLLVSGGSQSLAVDTELNSAALYHAERTLEDAYASSTSDFTKLVSHIVPSGAPWIDSQELFVTDVSPCVKRATSTVSWWGDKSRPQETSLASIFTSIEESEAFGGDCDTTEPSTPWKNPNTFTSRDIKPPIGPNAGIEATGIDVTIIDGKKVAVLTSKHPTESAPDVWLFDVSVDKGEEPPFLGSVDTGPGANGLDVVKGNDGRWYAYIANASSTASESSDELQVVDITDTGAPFLTDSITLGITPNCPTLCPGGVQSLYYNSERIYVGTHRIAIGDEFHVFDTAADPAHPVFLGSEKINHNINDIVVRDDYAYLATSDDEGELIMVDITDPDDMSGFDDTRTDGNLVTGKKDGTSLYLLGNTVYLGRENASAAHDFWVLDVADPSSISVLGSQDLNLNGANSRVEAIIVRGSLAFLGTSDPNEEFQVWDIQDPANIQQCSVFNFPETVTDLDFQDDLAYASVRSNDALHIIFDDPPNP